VATMHVELVSVEKALWSGEATAVFARTPEGELGVLPGHAPLLGALAPGFVVRIDREGDTSVKVAVHGGILSVRKDGVAVLGEMAEFGDEIDVPRARAALEAADANTDDGLAARNRAVSRLRAAGETV
jgi:F-type H+-transporting ATPase subunit epsilon